MVVAWVLALTGGGAMTGCGRQPVAGDVPLTYEERVTIYTLQFMTHHLEEALSSATDALAAAERAFPETDARIAQTANDLGAILARLDRPGEAEPYHRRALAIREQAEPPDPAALAQSCAGLAGVLIRQGQDEEAEPLLRRLLALASQQAEIPPIGRASLTGQLAELVDRLGRTDEADALFRQAVEELRATDAPSVPASAADPVLSAYAAFLARTGRTAEAVLPAR